MKKSNLQVEFELKSTTDAQSDDTGNFAFFEGYGAVFNNIDGAKDILLPNSIKSSRKRINLYWQHDRKEPIGTVVEAKEDTNGLYIKARLNLGVSRAKDAYALIKAGDISGLSIGYVVGKSSFNTDKKVRLLEEVDVWEISVVSEPCNTLAQVTSVKHSVEDIEAVETLRDVEGILCEYFSQKEAKTLIAKVKSFKRDVDEGEKTEAKDSKELEAEISKTKDLAAQIAELCKTL